MYIPALLITTSSLPNLFLVTETDSSQVSGHIPAEEMDIGIDLRSCFPLGTLEIYQNDFTSLATESVHDHGAKAIGPPCTLFVNPWQFQYVSENITNRLQWPLEQPSSQCFQESSSLLEGAFFQVWF
jgi:hypothetical protein